MCAVAKSEPGTYEFAMEVSKGHQLEREDIVARESFAQQVRDDELAARESLPSITESLRSSLIGDQWKDPDCGKACTQLLHAGPVADDAVPGTRRLSSGFASRSGCDSRQGIARGFQSSP